MMETVETPLSIPIIIWKNREIVKQQIDQRVSQHAARRASYMLPSIPFLP
jgi:hypothetical protein